MRNVWDARMMSSEDKRKRKEGMWYWRDADSNGVWMKEKWKNEKSVNTVWREGKIEWEKWGEVNGYKEIVIGRP